MESEVRPRIDEHNGKQRPDVILRDRVGSSGQDLPALGGRAYHRGMDLQIFGFHRLMHLLG